MELHILIAWNKARIDDERIISLFPSSLTLVRRFDYIWDEKYAKENYAAFYGEKLEDIQYKVDHCGKGPFRVFLVRDDNPVYSERLTSSGTRIVNSNLFDLKTKLRELTGGGHLIHASDSCLESNMNCMSLFGVLAEEVLQITADISESTIRRNVTGIMGWNSWEELLSTIDKLTPYIVLRNIESLMNDDNTLHGDTDLLVEDFHTAVTISVAHKEAVGNKRVLYSVKIGGVKRLVDFRYVGDRYYCKRWERNILKNRVKYENSDFYVARNEECSYTLLYHALVHKPFVSQDYKELIFDIFGTNDRSELMSILKKYLTKKHYSFTRPVDSSVFIHPDVFEYIKLPLYRKLVNSLKVLKYKKGGYERKNTGSQKIFKMLYRGYYMGLALLRKTKTGIRKMLH